MKTLSLILAILIFAVAGAVDATAQTVYLVCTWDTSSIFKGKDGREKFERRFYVSNTVSMAKEDVLKAESDDPLTGFCGEYLVKTVEKAALERGETLEGGTLKVRSSMSLSGENIGSKNMYTFLTKEEIEKKRDADIKEMLDANRFIMNFNWDMTGKAEAADYASEKKRVIPTPAPQKP
jgi:hypothetical protein